MYKEIVAGTGKPPLPDDVVTIHYEGTLVDGMMFDSTRRRQKPQVLPAGKIPVQVRAKMTQDKRTWILFVLYLSLSRFD